MTMKVIRAVSLDATGTIYRFRHNIGEIYSRNASLCGITPTIPPEIMDRSFKASFKKILKDYPVYGYHHNLSERQWWYRVVSHTFDVVRRDYCLDSYSSMEFDRCFRLIYQHYGSPFAYELYPDAISFIYRFQTRPLSDNESVYHKDTANLLSNNIHSLSSPKVPIYTHGKVVLGISTNSPNRTIESTLPSLGLHNNFMFFVSCKDTGVMKPGKVMWDKVFESVRNLIPNIQRDEILHIGDDFKADYCGAKAAGFQAFYLRRGLSRESLAFSDGFMCEDTKYEDIHRDIISSFDDIDIR